MVGEDAAGELGEEEFVDHAGVEVGVEESAVGARGEDVEGEVRSWQNAERRRRELPYEADGMVVKLDSRRLSDALGSTRHHPRHSLAFKWSERRLPRTRLEAGEWSVDQSGHRRPGAVVQPVRWEDGSTLARASLHNWAFVARHALAPGAEVEMERSGGTVPRHDRGARPRPAGFA